MQNGISAERLHLPELVRDRMYEILHPGEPVEKVLDFDRFYVLNGDYAVRSLQIENPQVRLSLFDMEGNLLAEGGSGDPLSLAGTQVGQVYALLAAPDPGAAEPPVMALSWEAAEPLQQSENLIANPGAEVVEGESNIPGWEVMAGYAEPRLYFYDESEENPSPEGPGPEERGFHLFAGGEEGELSAIQQVIQIDPNWQGAIDEGRVRFSFGAFLGGKLQEEDSASAALVFLDAEGQELGRVELPSITARERDGQSGLFPVAVSDYLLAGTSQVRVELAFHGFEDGFNDGYADNLELALYEYAP